MSGDLTEWLGAHGLLHYAKVFAENDVDFRALQYLTDQDLRELGFSLGHRKVALAAIAELTVVPASHPPQPPAEKLPGNTYSDDAELRLLTILFCDLVGSTSLSQELDPEAMRDLLNAYQDAVAGAVTRFEGHVAKYLGDGVLAYFGWPVAYEDQAERAIRAGFEALQRVEKLTGPHGFLEARIGIATGQVVVGNLESERGRESAAVAGETPNRAARIQAVAEPGALLIDTETARLTGGAFTLVERGAVPLKGFERPVELLQVVGESRAESRFLAYHGSTASTLVGRVSEFDLLKSRWLSACGGEGQLVAVSGEAGIGKSRLVEALIEEIAKAPHMLVRLQGSPYHTSSPLHPVSERLRKLAGIFTEDTGAAKLEKLRNMLAGDADDEERVVLLADLLSLPRDRPAPKFDTSPHAVRERTIATLIDRLVGFAETAPTLIVAEDAHWIDPTTHDLLTASARRTAALPVMIVLTHRPEWRPDWVHEIGGGTMSLTRLDRPQVAELVGTIVTDYDSRMIDDIIARTDGVPLFVEELARAALESHATVKGVPLSLRASLMARLDRLSAEARTVAQFAAVIGREFETNLLVRLSGLSAETVTSALRVLCRERLVVASTAINDTYSFRHALIQDTAYGALLAKTRKRHHQRVSEVLAETPGFAEGQPEILAHHLSEAGLPLSAFPHWVIATRRALKRGANFEAVTLAEKVVEILQSVPPEDIQDADRLTARSLMGIALGSAGRLRESVEPLRLAVDEAERLGDLDTLVTAVFELDRSCFLLGEPMLKARQGLRAIERRLEPDAIATRCRVASRLARIAFQSGELDDAARYTQDAEALARRTNDDEALFDVLFNGFLIPANARSPERLTFWHEQIDELHMLAERSNEDDARGRAMSLAIYVAAEMADRERMDLAMSDLVAFGRKRERMHIDWIVAHGHAMVAILEGDFAAAEASAEQAFDIGPRTYGHNLEGVYGIQMFTIRREQGRLAEVAPVMKKLIDDAPFDATWRPGFGIVASELGYHEVADRILSEMAEENFPLPVDSMRSTTLSYLAEIASRSCDEERASILYNLLGAYRSMTITAGVTSLCLGAAGRHLGLLAASLGDWDAAEEHFETALRINTEMRTPVWLAHSQADFAAMLYRRGRQSDRKRANDLSNAALVTADALGMKSLGDQLRTTVH